MATRNEIESLIFYVLGENNRQLLIKSGLDGVPKEARVTALRGLQDLGWIGHGGLADYEESYSLTKEGRGIVANHPEIKALDRSLQEHVAALREVDGGSNGTRKEALKKLVALQCDTSNWDSALLNCFELKKLAERTKDVESFAFALFYQGRVEVAQNRWDEALESYLNAIEKYMEAGDRRGVCLTNGAMGIVYGNKGDHASAIRCFESSLSMAKSIGDKHAEAKALGNLAIIYDLEGRTEESENASKNCLKYFLEIGDMQYSCRISNNLGVLNMSRERFTDAAEYFEKTISACRTTRNMEVLGAALVNAGYCCARAGDIDTSLRYTDEAVTVFKEPNNLNMLALAYRNYAYVEFHNSNLQMGFEWFEKSVRAARSSGVEDTFAACCYEYGMALLKSAIDPKLAKKLLKKSSVVYREIGNVALARKAEATLAGC
jgi:tetratricopeptide (TPR) repeat protein